MHMHVYTCIHTHNHAALPTSSTSDHLLHQHTRLTIIPCLICTQRLYGELFQFGSGQCAVTDEVGEEGHQQERNTYREHVWNMSCNTHLIPAVVACVVVTHLAANDIVSHWVCLLPDSCATMLWRDRRPCESGPYRGSSSQLSET